MSEKPISPLRQRMLEDMSVRRFTPDTQREYIRAVKRLAAFLGRSPDTATPEELRAFQLHLTEGGVRPPTINATVTALRFFFNAVDGAIGAFTQGKPVDAETLQNVIPFAPAQPQRRR